MHKPRKLHMETWQELKHHAGFDWAKDHHDVLVVNSEGRIVADFEFEHTLEGWLSFVQKTSAWPHLAVAIETSQGPAVDQLLQRGYTIYPVHPVAANSYRKRQAPSGTKTDRHDAWALADALRTDGHRWKALQPLDPLSQQLRLLCRDEVTLIEQRTALVNQLQQALLEYYPAALEASTIGLTPPVGSLSWGFRRRRPWPVPASGAGRSSCTPTGFGDPKRRTNAWRFSLAPPSSKPLSRLCEPRASWPSACADCSAS